MNKSYISTLVQFNFWANSRILAACEQIAPAEFTRHVTPDPGWGSLQGILVHTLDTEYGWRANLQRQDADIILQESDFADVAALKPRWESERAAWLEYVTSLSPESLNQSYSDDPANETQVWQVIMHVIIHGTQHRSEVAAILTGLDRSPGELDFGIYLSENP